MLIGFYMCIILVPCFAVLALVFAVFKEKSVKLISGFNTLPKWKQEKYDRKRMAKDYRNHFALWSVIMLEEKAYVGSVSNNPGNHRG